MFCVKKLIAPKKAYKSVVAHVVPRPVAMRRFWQLQGHKAIIMPKGELVAQLKEDDLMKE
jgi:hypothetical protein